MEAGKQYPTTLQDAIKFFADPDNALKFMVSLRWPDGVQCPHCDHREVSFLSTRRIWKCKGYKKQFSVKVGSILEDSPLKLETWLCGIWLIGNAKNGISSHEVSRSLGITQKSAWFLLHRIRLAMKRQSFAKMTGEVEADETLIGGKEKNKHADKKLNAGRGAVGKAIVMGIRERGGEVRTKHIPNTKGETLGAEIRANVEVGSAVYTDIHKGYDVLNEDYVHDTVNHNIGQYVKGCAHTNGLENYWSLFKRGYHGTWTHLSEMHLGRYLDEQEYRYNNRSENDGQRFVGITAHVTGKRLTYKQLTRKATPTGYP
jgi:transposase-like protein